VWKKLRPKKKVKAALYMAFSYAKARKIFLGMILMNSCFFCLAMFCSALIHGDTRLKSFPVWRMVQITSMMPACLY
jgi:hypothetical protein